MTSRRYRPRQHPEAGGERIDLVMVLYPRSSCFGVWQRCSEPAAGANPSDVAANDHPPPELSRLPFNVLEDCVDLVVPYGQVGGSAVIVCVGATPSHLHHEQHS